MAVEEKKPRSGIETSGGLIGQSGLYTMTFLLKTNKGYDPQPIEKIASGGELSRVMLAIKGVMAAQDPVSTYLFDEVDAGVGGETGETIAEMPKEISTQRQVLCITHLAQVASKAETHLQICKKSNGAQTSTTIEKLDEGSRVTEIARMIGGRANQTQTWLCARRKPASAEAQRKLRALATDGSGQHYYSHNPTPAGNKEQLPLN